MWRLKLPIDSPVLSRDPIYKAKCKRICACPLTIFEPLDGHFFNLTKYYKTLRLPTSLFYNFLYSLMSMMRLYEPLRWEPIDERLWKTPSRTLQLLIKYTLRSYSIAVVQKLVFGLGIWR
jgi:hypothetical protein